ncbi:MAG: hypothetical protein WAM09_05445 [Anaerolineales bacterium]
MDIGVRKTVQLNGPNDHAWCLPDIGFIHLHSAPALWGSVEYLLGQGSRPIVFAY